MLNLALAQQLAGTAAAHNKTWCYPSHESLRAAMQRFHHQTISPRTITRHLDALEAAGWIRRKCRHQAAPDGHWTFRSTLYVILGPCQRALRALAKTVAYFRRFSRRPHVADSSTPTVYNSLPTPLSGVSATAKRTPPPNWAASMKKILAP